MLALRFALTVAAVAAPAAIAQVTARTAAADAPWPGLDRRTLSRSDRVLFAVAPRLGARCVDGRLTVTRAPNVEGALRAALGERRIEPLLPAGVAAGMPSRRASVEAAPLPALDRWFRVAVRGAADAQRTVARLRALRSVQFAYLEPRPIAFDDRHDDRPRPRDRWFDEPSPALHDEQAHFAPAPRGIGHREVGFLSGARGEGRRLAIVEAGWTATHEDLPRLADAERITLVRLPSPSDPRADHALATAGLLLAARDDRGVDGLVPDVDRVVLVDLGAGSAVAIAAATLRLSPGDVICCSFGYSLWTGGGLAHAPLDWDPATRDVIAHAAAAGVVVCLAAGNSGRDLGDREIFGDRYAQVRRHGALLVGATTDGGLTRHPGSNFGAAIDVVANGDGVVTTGYGDRFDPGDPERRYTARYGGTSAATAIVAGGLTALVGAIGARHGSPPSLETIRRWIRTTGPRLDIADVLRRARLPDGLRLVAEPDASTLVVRGDPGAAFTLLLTAESGQADTVGLGFGRIGIDLRTALAQVSGRCDGRGTAQIALPHALRANPPVPAHAQALVLRAGQLAWTSVARIDAGRPRTR